MQRRSPSPRRKATEDVMLLGEEGGEVRELWSMSGGAGSHAGTSSGSGSSGGGGGGGGGGGSSSRLSMSAPFDTIAGWSSGGSDLLRSASSRALLGAGDTREGSRALDPGSRGTHGHVSQPADTQGPDPHTVKHLGDVQQHSSGTHEHTQASLLAPQPRVHDESSSDATPEAGGTTVMETQERDPGGKTGAGGGSAAGGAATGAIIPRESQRYDVGRRFGQGHFGEVWRALRRQDGSEDPVAPSRHHSRDPRNKAGERGAGSPEGAAPGRLVVLKRILGERGPAVWRSGQREVHFGREVLRLASLTVGGDGPDGRGFDHLGRFLESFTAPAPPPSTATDLWIVLQDEGTSLHSLIYAPVGQQHAHATDGTTSGMRGSGGTEGMSQAQLQSRQRGDSPTSHGSQQRQRRRQQHVTDPTHPAVNQDPVEASDSVQDSGDPAYRAGGGEEEGEGEEAGGFEILGSSSWWQELRTGPAGHDAVRQLLRQLLAALSELHTHNITHRDVKPGVATSGWGMP
ncbi:MAG: hypothetical protein WDW38_003336 [Sanguina aurantia]